MFFIWNKLTAQGMHISPSSTAVWTSEVLVIKVCIPAQKYVRKWLVEGFSSSSCACRSWIECCCMFQIGCCGAFRIAILRSGKGGSFDKSGWIALSITYTFAVIGSWGELSMNKNPTQDSANYREYDRNAFVIQVLCHNSYLTQLAFWFLTGEYQ